MQKNQILTEATYTITCVTAKNTQTISNKIANFDYKNIKEKLYLGFKQNRYFGIPVNEASKSKALFDYLYFKSLPRVPFGKNYNLAEDLRLNLVDWQKSEIDEFGVYVNLSAMTKMREVYENLKRNIWHNL